MKFTLDEWLLASPSAKRCVALLLLRTYSQGTRHEERIITGASGGARNRERRTDPNLAVPEVIATVVTVFNAAEFVVDAGGGMLSAKVPVTGGWNKFQIIEPGQIQIKKAGNLVLKIRARNAASWKAINLNFLKLVPVAQP